MTHKSLVNGTAYEIVEGRMLVNGTGYDIVKGRTLVDGTGYDINFYKYLGDLPVGDTVRFRLKGLFYADFIVVQQGNPDSTFYDTSCHDTWLMMKDIYIMKEWYGGEGNLYVGNPDDGDTGEEDGNDRMHWYLNDEFLSMFDDDVKALIKEVKIPYVTGSNNLFDMKYGADGVTAKIFLLSGYEVAGEEAISKYFTSEPIQYGYFPKDGCCLSYFKDTTIPDDKRIAHVMEGRYLPKEGEPIEWWLRSPKTNTFDHAWLVNTNGAIEEKKTWTTQIGVRPAMVLPFETKVIRKEPHSYELYMRKG